VKKEESLIARVSSNPERNCIYYHRKEYRYKILKEYRYKILKKFIHH